MGLSKKRTTTNLMILRDQLNRLNVKDDAMNEANGSGACESKKENQQGGKILQEAKKKGRKKNALIDGSKLLC